MVDGVQLPGHQAAAEAAVWCFSAQLLEAVQPAPVNITIFTPVSPSVF